MSEQDARKVERVLDLFVPPAVRTLIRHRYQMLDQLGKDPGAELMPQLVSRSIQQAAAPTPHDVWAALAGSEDPRPLVTCYAAMRAYADALRQGHRAEPPPNDPVQTILAALRHVDPET